MLNYWLAGLIEGDGSIIIPNNKLQYPYIRIAFHEKDLPLAKKLTEWVGYGNINEVKSSKLVVWTVYEEEALKDLINRINGKMRTPKVHRLDKLIDWYNLSNKKAGHLLVSKGLDSTPLDSNAWLAGMSDADSNFNIIISSPFGRNSIRIQTHWRLEFSQKTYHGYDQLYWGSLISSFLNTTLYSRSREIEGRLYSSFIVMTYSEKSNQTIIDYFNKYPLLSTKYLDFKDWVRVVEIQQKKKEKQNNLLRKTKISTDLLKEVEILKAGMNNKRRRFNWDHLNLITNYF